MTVQPESALLRLELRLYCSNPQLLPYNNECREAVTKVKKLANPVKMTYH